MIELNTFNFNGLGDVRAFIRDEEVWFIAKDVATLLGYRDTDQAIRAHCKSTDTYPVNLTGQVRHIKSIPERDVYRLIMRSKLPAAEQFEEWVVGVVLPSIRKTGGYVKGEEHCESEEELTLRVMQMLQRKIEAMKPKADYFDKWQSGDGSYTTTELAKKLGTTAQKLNIFLRENNIKFKNKDLPTAGHEDWFSMVERCVNDTIVKPQCKISPLGCEKITELFKKAS